MAAPIEVDMGPVDGGFPAGNMVGVDVTEHGLVVEFTDGTALLSTEWLRDNCRCGECRIAQADERRALPWARPDAAVKHASARDGLLRVAFSDGHLAMFTADTFATIDRAARRGAHPIRLWQSDSDLGRFDHDEVVRDHVIRRDFLEAFRRDGVAVVTASPTVPGSVITFMDAIGVAVRELSIGRIFDIVVDPAGWNVAYTSEAVPPHNDFANYTNPPSGQVLAMLVNDAHGGESAVVDGWGAVHRLAAHDPSAVDVLSRVEVGFRQYSDSAEVFSSMPLVRRDSAGRVIHLRFSNQLMQPLPFDHPDLAEWYRAYRLLGAQLSDPANQVQFRLGGGDMLFVNNHRVLHARSEFSPDGARHLQDVYFDADEMAGNLARMTGDAINAMIRA